MKPISTNGGYLTLIPKPTLNGLWVVLLPEILTPELLELGRCLGIPRTETLRLVVDAADFLLGGGPQHPLTPPPIDSVLAPLKGVSPDPVLLHLNRSRLDWPHFCQVGEPDLSRCWRLLYDGVITTAWRLVQTAPPGCKEISYVQTSKGRDLFLRIRQEGTSRESVVAF